MLRELGTLAMLAAMITAAEDRPAKEPWRWTDEERIRARFSPGSAASRVEEARTADRGAPALSMPRRPKAGRPRTTDADTLIPTDYIDGSLHPELLLPIELFNDLVLSGYSPDPSEDVTEFRRETLGRWREFGLSRDPHDLLLEETAEMVKILRTDRRRARKREPGAAAHAGSTSGSPYLCEASEALRRVQRALGPADYSAFLALLYGTLAPGRRSFSVEPLEKIEADLRSRVRGCE